MSTPQGVAVATDRVRETKNDLFGIASVFIWGGSYLGKLMVSLLQISIAASFTMVAAWLLGQMVAQLLAGHYGSARLYGFGFVGCELLSVTFQYFGRVSLARVTTTIVNEIRKRLFHKMTVLPIAYFDRQPMGRTITRMTHDVEGVETFFAGTLARILVALIQIGAVLIALVATSPVFGFWIGLACLPSLIASVLTRKWIRDQLRYYKRVSAQLNALFAELISGITVIKLFGLEGWSFDRVHGESMRLLEAGLRTLSINSVVRPMIVFLCSIPTIIVLWWGGLQVLDGTLSIAVLVAFIRYCERFMSPIRTISQEVQLIQEALVSSERVRQMLLEPQESDVLGPDGDHAGEVQGEVVFDGVVLEYLPGQTVLDRVSFVAKAGQKIALVGHTGSGKTSTVHLLPRFYPIKSGSIRIDGVQVKDWCRSALRDAIGYVSQDVVIFRGTMRDNLCSAVGSDRRITDDEIMMAALRTGLYGSIQRTPHGLDSMILDEGANLSQGERQLVALTRMLLKDPAIMILDEATANIDEHSEQLVQQAITEVLTHRTCFIVAHRLSTVIDCDVILLFRRGKIIAHGSHAELMSSSNYYQQLVESQLNSAAPKRRVKPREHPVHQH